MRTEVITLGDFISRSSAKLEVWSGYALLQEDLDVPLSRASGHRASVGNDLQYPYEVTRRNVRRGGH